jgi:7-carboxy-7-deazaguanine synthase
MNAKTYRINDIFYSLQGEGMRSGTANIFIRFSGCNEKCLIETHGFDCDTEFVSGSDLTAEEICTRAKELNPNCTAVILTGGEPLLQVDKALCDALKMSGYYIAVETNGSINPNAEVLPMLDWITCSPKVAEHAVRLERCEELKYVRNYGQAIPKPKLSCNNLLISPAFNGDYLDRKSLDWCINLSKENPSWRLTVQLHKLLFIR